jgi:hypothetical protein
MMTIMSSISVNPAVAALDDILSTVILHVEIRIVITPAGAIDWFYLVNNGRSRWPAEQESGVKTTN